MISRVYISHDPDDEDLALRLSMALERVGLDTYVALYNQSPAISLAERVSFAIRNSECLVALATLRTSQSPALCQEIGLARGIDQLIIPLQEEGARLPFLIDQLRTIAFRMESYSNAIGILFKTIRELSRLEWLKVACPKLSSRAAALRLPCSATERKSRKSSHEGFIRGARFKGLGTVAYPKMNNFI